MRIHITTHEIFAARHAVLRSERPFTSYSSLKFKIKISNRGAVRWINGWCFAGAINWSSRNPMDILHDETSRTISAGEIKDWVGKSLKPSLSEAQCGEIAVFLTRCRWPGDPPDPPDSPWLIGLIKDAPEEWWDFKGVAHAARTLLDNMPAIVSHWDGRQGSTGTDAVIKLKEALSETIEHLEWPFGRYERQTGQKQPKPWHPYARGIARSVISAMIEAGHKKPAATRNSVAVRIVQKTLIRMSFLNVHMITQTAIAAYLTRWDKKYGLTPQGIAALTTKQRDRFVAVPS